MRVVVVQMVALLSLVRAVVRVAVHGAVKALTVQVVVLQRACVGVRGGHSGSDGANSASGAAVGGGSAGGGAARGGGASGSEDFRRCFGRCHIVRGPRSCA